MKNNLRKAFEDYCDKNRELCDVSKENLLKEAKDERPEDIFEYGRQDATEFIRTFLRAENILI